MLMYAWWFSPMLAAVTHCLLAHLPNARITGTALTLATQALWWCSIGCDPLTFSVGSSFLGTNRPSRARVGSSPNSSLNCAYVSPAPRLSVGAAKP